MLSLDYVDVKSEERKERTQNMLLIIQTLLFFCYDLMTLKMYWRYSNPIEHHVLFKVSQTLEQNRSRTSFDLTDSEEAER